MHCDTRCGLKKSKETDRYYFILFEEKCGRLSLKLQNLLDFVTFCIGIPCTSKYFIVTTFHIFHSQYAIAVLTPSIAVKIPC